MYPGVPTEIIMSKTPHAVLFLLLLAASSIPTAGDAEDWPHWQGLHRNATINEPSHFKGGNWPPSKPAWSIQTSAGGSGVIVTGDRLYTMGWKDDQDHILCIDTASGTTIWKQSYNCPPYGRESEGDKGIYSGPSSCPSYDKQTGYLYTLSTDGDLCCWDTKAEGRAVWKVNFYDAYQVPKRPKVGRRQLRDYGYTTAPLVHGDTVIVEVGDGDQSACVGHLIDESESMHLLETRLDLNKIPRVVVGRKVTG